MYRSDGSNPLAFALSLAIYESRPRGSGRVGTDKRASGSDAKHGLGRKVSFSSHSGLESIPLGILIQSCSPSLFATDSPEYSQVLRPTSSRLQVHQPDRCPVAARHPLVNKRLLLVAVVGGERDDEHESKRMYAITACDEDRCACLASNRMPFNAHMRSQAEYFRRI